MRIAFFGSSLVSCYWNGAATYYRGLLKELAALGHQISFYEPDAFERQQHRDMADPDWARVVVYPASEQGWQTALAEAKTTADVLVKASGIGVFDSELEYEIANAPASFLRIFWDVDAPATLEAVAQDSGHQMRRLASRFDIVLTYGGGDPVVRGYRQIGARDCVPVYNALDPATHFPVEREARFGCDLSFLGNRLPDREARVEAYFLEAARLLPRRTFLLGGAGWHDRTVPPNVTCVGHVGTGVHNAFFSSGLSTLNINRDSMARFGFSPPTRVFEAAGAGACLISDRWDGIDLFLEPDREVLVAGDGSELAALLDALDSTRAQNIAAAARRRVIAHHTYARRATQVDAILQGYSTRNEAAE